MKRVFRRPSPAMVVAIVALIAALGGTAIAGGALNKKKVNKIITNRAPGLSVKDSANLGGTAAAGIPKVTQFAYGEISDTGALKPPSASAPPNRGITQVVPQGVTGVYCIKLSFTPTFGTGDGTGASGFGTTAMVDIPATNCATALPGASATVYVANGAGTATNDDFTVLFGGF
jgi:hypothetical protein